MRGQIRFWGSGGSPRGTQFDGPLRTLAGHGSEGVARALGDRASDMPRVESVYRFGEPTPDDLRHQWIIDQLRLHFRPDEDDSTECPFPFVNAVRIVQEDESPTGGVVVQVGHFRGDGEGVRSQPLRCRRLLEDELRTGSDTPDGADGTLERLGGTINDLHPGTVGRPRVPLRGGAPLGPGDVPEGYGIDAVPEISRCRVALALEDVAQVATAGGAPHLGPHAAQGPVIEVDHGVTREGGVEAGPAAMRRELRIRSEQLGTTRAALVDPRCHGVGVLTRERRLGPGFAQDVVRLRIQTRLPFALVPRGRIRSSVRTRSTIACGGCRHSLRVRLPAVRAPDRRDPPEMKALR